MIVDKNAFKNQFIVCLFQTKIRFFSLFCIKLFDNKQI